MKLTLNLDNGTVKYTTNVTQRKVGGLLTNLKNKSTNISGTARVEYKRGYHNDFEFDGREDFMRKFLPCIEPELVNDFKV